MGSPTEEQSRDDVSTRHKKAINGDTHHTWKWGRGGRIYSTASVCYVVCYAAALPVRKWVRPLLRASKTRHHSRQWRRMHIKMHIIHTKGILASIPATPSSNTVSNHTELLRVGFPLQALNTSSTVRHRRKHLAEHR